MIMLKKYTLLGLLAVGSVAAADIQEQKSLQELASIAYARRLCSHYPEYLAHFTPDTQGNTVSTAGLRVAMGTATGVFGIHCQENIFLRNAFTPSIIRTMGTTVNECIKAQNEEFLATHANNGNVEASSEEALGEAAYLSLVNTLDYIIDEADEDNQH